LYLLCADSPLATTRGFATKAATLNLIFAKQTRTVAAAR